MATRAPGIIAPSEPPPMYPRNPQPSDMVRAGNKIQIHMGRLVDVMTKPSYAAFGLCLFFACACEAATVEERALEFLSKEVPRWRIENGCYSCHNNGDAARALFTAVRMKIAVDAAALSNIRWNGCCVRLSGITIVATLGSATSGWRGYSLRLRWLRLWMPEW